MMTACELCDKIALEKALKEAETKKRKLKCAKAYAEQVLNPILSKLNELPDHLFIGYKYPDDVELFHNISEWKDGWTPRGNYKRTRDLIDNSSPLKFPEYARGDFDYDVLNEYLASFGFEVSYKRSSFIRAEYSTSTPDDVYHIDEVYITAICPLKE